MYGNSSVTGLDHLWHISSARTRSISPENPSGEKGAGATADPEPDGPARELGRGWKCRPFITVESGEERTLAQMSGPGAITSMWFGGAVDRDAILRLYWEDQSQPSVEAPITDFFGIPWGIQNPQTPTAGPLVLLNSLPVAVNPNRGLNCFWQMPFRCACRVTLQNLHPNQAKPCFYQVNYVLADLPDEIAYFHAQFRRVNPLPYSEVYPILDRVRGKGQYVGTSMGWGVNNSGWWGEGEIKFYLDGDGEYPTICGTGTEDYFGGSYNWEVDGTYVTYSTPFLGMHHVARPDGAYRSQQRHAMYRWHVVDPIHFESDLRVSIQALGWRSEGRYFPGQHDISSVAYWYQTLPTAPFPRLPDRDALEIV